MPKPLPAPWPARPLIYQIYPRSFQDTDGDGVGDLRGISQRIDHIASLGVDAIWICPFTQSPWVDGGYDVGNYTKIDPRLGDAQAWNDLVETFHQNGIRVMVDLVLNHTSDRHPWFERSVAGEDGFDTRYVWRDARPDGSPPTNWQSRFGVPAWTWNHRRQQYYLHNYLPDQPALNLRCEHVQASLRDVFHHWLNTGVDGFRLDAVTSYLCDPEFRDNPPADAEARRNMDGEDFLPYVRQDHAYDFLPGDGVAYTEHLRDWAGEAAWLLGEVATGNQSVEIGKSMSQSNRLNSAYVVDIPQFGFTIDTVSDILSRQGEDNSVGCTWWTRSHDRARVQPGDNAFVEAAFELFFCTFMPGPALIYQGQELGLTQPPLRYEDATDPYDRRFWPDGPGREAARVPMPWSAMQKGYGFTDGKPWLPMEWPGELAVDQQDIQADSLLSIARQATALRRAEGLHKSLGYTWHVDGDLLLITYETGSVLALNFGNDPVSLERFTDYPIITSWQGAMHGQDLAPRSGAYWSDLSQNNE